MKYHRFNSKKHGDETDAEQSNIKAIAAKRAVKRKRIPKYMRQFKRINNYADYFKILRFKTRNLKKTFRFYCYEEDSLGWPYRFTKKVNKVMCDNDRDSDSQVIQHDKNRCLSSLFQAIQQRKNEKTNMQ